MAPAPGDGGGGGGGGSEGGKGGDGKGGEEKAALTEEDVGRMINGAFTSQLKRLLPGMISEAVSGLKLDEKLAAIEAKVAESAKPQESTKGGKGSEESETTKELKAIKVQLEEEKAARVAAETARQQADEQRLFDGAKLALRGALKEKANEDFLDDWVDRLAVLDKKLTVTDDGAAILKVKRVPYKGAQEEEVDLPLAEAVPILLARPESKKYLPAPSGASGKGARGPTNGSATTRVPSANSDNPLDRAQAKLAELGINFEDEFG